MNRLGSAPAESARATDAPATHEVLLLEVLSTGKGVRAALRDADIRPPSPRSQKGRRKDRSDLL